MKKTVLRILLWVARFAGSWGIGYLLGTIANLILGKILDEKMAEEHPYITILIWLSAVAVACGATLLIVTYPLTWAFEWFDNKIDRLEDEDPFEKD